MRYLLDFFNWLLTSSCSHSDTSRAFRNQEDGVDYVVCLTCAARIKSAIQFGGNHVVKTQEGDPDRFKEKADGNGSSPDRSRSVLSVVAGKSRVPKRKIRKVS